MAQYFITADPNVDWENLDLSKIVGSMQFAHTVEGKACEELLKTGKFNIVPYGFGEKDKDGNITSFVLKGFSISKKE